MKPLGSIRGGLFAVAVLAAVLGAACNNPSTTTSPAGGGGPGESVNISNFAFDPANITISAGSSVTWTNEDTATHTVVADDNSWSSQGLAQNATYTHTFTTAGVYPYHCSVHPDMKGTITVTS